MFYGTILSEDEARKFVSKLGKEALEGRDDKYDVGTPLYNLSQKGEFKWIPIDPFDGETECWEGIASYSKTVGEWDSITPKKFTMPKQDSVDKEWQKIAKKYGIRKKPGWYLVTEYT